MEDGDRRRLLTKVARLYHHSGLRQVEIADRLRISQTRVSRLLWQAEADGIVHTVVVPLIGLNATIEEQLEDRYSLAEAHLVDTVADSEDELGAELGEAAAAIFAGAHRGGTDVPAYARRPSPHRTSGRRCSPMTPTRGRRCACSTRSTWP